MSVDVTQADVNARACAATYIVFSVIGATPLLINILFAVRAGRAKALTVGPGLQILLTAIGFLLLLLIWVHAFKLQVRDGLLFYRTLFGGTRTIPLDEIASADIKFGPDAPFGPFYRLTVHPSPGANRHPIVINMKVFSKKDLNTLFDILGPKLKGGRRFSIFERKSG